MPPTPIAFSEKLSLFSELWSPRVVAEMNDYQLKLAKIRGQFAWHSHPDTDEVFIVLEGEMSIAFRDGSIDLKAGEMVVVPKGVEHLPSADEECSILLIEPRGVINTGDGDSSELTAANDVWI